MQVRFATAALCTSAIAAVAAVALSGPAPALAAAPGKAAANADSIALLDKYCSSCHGVDQVTAKSRTAQQWAATIDKMIDYGAQITPADAKRLQAFLSAHYGEKK